MQRIEIVAKYFYENNAIVSKLRMPFVTLDLQPSEDGRRKKRSGSFLYDLDILLKNVLPSGPGTFHDGLATDQVMPGCGVLITGLVNFLSLLNYILGQEIINNCANKFRGA